MKPPLPACVAATRRRPASLVLSEALRAALLGMFLAWGLAELALALQGF